MNYKCFEINNFCELRLFVLKIIELKYNFPDKFKNSLN